MSSFRRKILAFLLVFSTGANKSFEIVRPDETVADAVGCLEEIAGRNFQKSGKLLFVLASQYLKPDGRFLVGELLRRLHANGGWNLVTSTGALNYFEPYVRCDERGDCKEIITRVHKTSYYVIIVENFQQFSIVLKRARTFKNFNTRAKYVTYLADAPGQKRSARKILETLWEKNVSKSLLVTGSKISGLNVFARSKRCGTNPRVVPLGECGAGKLLSGGARLYDHVAKPKLKGCFLNVITMKYPPFVTGAHSGFEMAVVDEIAKKMDLKLNVELQENIEEWDMRDSHDDWVGKLACVKHNFSIGIGCVRPNQKIYEDFDFTFDYYQDELVWVVPKARRAPQWECIVVIFSPRVWLINLGVISACGTLVYFVARKTNDASNFKSLGYSLLVSLQTFLGASVYKKPKADVKRAVLVSLAVYSIIICCVYQSLLIEIMTNPPLYERQISTEKDILDSNLAICGIENLRHIFNSSEDPNSLKIHKKYRAFRDDRTSRIQLLEGVTLYRNTCTISNKLHLLYVMSQGNPLVFGRGTPKIYLLRKKLFAYPVKMVVPKEFFLLEIFNELIAKFVAHGLVIKWAEKYVHRVRKFTGREREMADSVRLSLDHVQGAFALLLVGCVSGTLVFLLEIVLNKATVSREKLPKITRFSFGNKRWKKFLK